MRWHRLPVPFPYLFLGGLLLGLILGINTYFPYWIWGETTEYSFLRYAMPHIINYSLWPILLPLIYFWYKEYPVSRESRPLGVLWGLLYSVLIALIHEVLSSVIYFLPLHLAGMEDFVQNALNYVKGVFYSAWISRIIEYWIIYAMLAAVDYYRRYRNKQLELSQLENQLSQARLNALRLQLHPHFLFNTLNTISSLMEINIKEAQRMVSRLGDLLRHLLEGELAEMVYLEEELQFIQHYLAIELVRFQDRLKVSYEIDPETRMAVVPSLVLQPLVENAIKHGFSTQTETAHIRVWAQKVGERLHIGVKDDGQGAELEREVTLSPGIGLRNLRDRLALRFGDAAHMEIKTAPQAGFEVLISLPHSLDYEKNSYPRD